jgi:UDP-N-acetylmuramyl pentapeptide phosphotransferase/UDP-N-acetylglucosamine-1-phosphate transferase
MIIFPGGLKSHETKRGTLTMGGVVFVVASWIGYVAGHALTDSAVTAHCRANPIPWPRPPGARAAGLASWVVTAQTWRRSPSPR